jgi:myo-inositol 2-dehydrogenase / D-chiro-inositol 1-dehydrogenase
MGSFHARTLSDVPGISLSAVVDSRPDVAAKVGEEAGTIAITSIDEARALPGVDAWLIATPTPTHPELVKLALDDGIHVLCEKPLALSEGDASVVGEMADRAGLVLQVGFWRRFSPPWARAKDLLDAGVIGRPLMIRLAQWDANPPPPGFCDPAVSGGLAIDCGVHEYDLAEWLTGQRVRRVFARNLPIVDESVGEAGDVDNLVALLDLTGGVTAIVDLTRNARYGDDVRTEILGSDGAIFVDMLPAGRTRLATRAGVEVVGGSEVADATAAGLAAQAQALVAAIRGERDDIPGAAASSRAVQVGRAVQLSAERSEPVEL